MAKRVILVVIILAMLSVVAGAIDYFFIKSETVIESSLSKIASDYYENVYYNSILESNPSNKTLEERLKRYSEIGFSKVSLRQLLITVGANYSEASTVLKKHCNENKTYVKFFPEPPYDRKNYHTEYTYSCDSK